MLFLDHFSQLGCTLQTNPQFKAFTAADEQYVLKAQSEAVTSIHKKLTEKGKTNVVTISASELIKWYKNPTGYNLYENGSPPPPAPPVVVNNDDNLPPQPGAAGRNDDDEDDSDSDSPLERRRGGKKPSYLNR